MNSLREARFLASDEGREALARLSDPGDAPTPSGRSRDLLALSKDARKLVGSERAPALLTQLELRSRARAKFARAEQMLFTRDALEQASAEEVARYRARRFEGARLVVDAGCSIGGDLLALASVAPTIGIDLDPTRLFLARENLRVHDLAPASQRLVAADARRFDIDVDGLFADPARRDDARKRLVELDEIRPPFRTFAARLDRIPRIGVKLSPAVDVDRLPQAAEVELISVRGECREAVAWMGELRTCARRATLLPSGETFTARDEAARRVDVPVRGAVTWLFDPDPSLIRAGLLLPFAERHGLDRVDPHLAYLTGERVPESGFVRAYRVIESFRFGLKELRRRVRQHGIGRLEIKKRGFPIVPEELRRKLRLDGERAMTLILARIHDRHEAFLTEAVGDTPPAPSRGEDAPCSDDRSGTS